jgi:ADP-glucose pyrophosphorylase
MCHNQSKVKKLYNYDTNLQLKEHHNDKFKIFEGKMLCKMEYSAVNDVHVVNYHPVTTYIYVHIRMYICGCVCVRLC